MKFNLEAAPGCFHRFCFMAGVRLALIPSRAAGCMALGEAIAKLPADARQPDGD
jgi:hypothetical protein